MPKRVKFTSDLKALYVGRPTKFGNCYSHKAGIAQFKVSSKSIALQKFYERIQQDPEFQIAIKAELAGKDLSCWCDEDEPCHGDILLSIANDLPLPWFLFPKENTSPPTLF